jgi:hypothetical protein
VAAPKRAIARKAVEFRELSIMNAVRAYTTRLIPYSVMGSSRDTEELRQRKQTPPE